MHGSLLSQALAVGVPLAYVLGVLSALDALMNTRTPQGAVAWILALVSMPFVALPLYWAFRRVQFSGYVRVLRSFDREVERRVRERNRRELEHIVIRPSDEADLRARGELTAFHRLATHPMTCGNHAGLLVNGEQTFDAIFEAIDAAEHYVLAQFYIIADDGLGRAFKNKLLQARARGVRVYLLYDEVGSYGLPKSYIAALRAAGAEVSGFSGKRQWIGRFRINFRNHRKIVVVDGRLGFVGGLNVADDYMSRNTKLSPWRDTHLALEGPAVLGLQFSFLRDWYYGRQETLDVQWSAETHPADQRGLILASGPADALETCGLLFTHAIESAEKRVWIATPYFVPDGRILGALQLAALRGIDVRVIMPRQSDSFLFHYVPYAYLPDAESAGVKIYLYEPGFMHQKVLLVDDDYAAVGTANLDNRSFRLNFEVTCLVSDAGFSRSVEEMLISDFALATRLTEEDLAGHSFAFKLATQATRLLAPVL